MGRFFKGAAAAIGIVTIGIMGLVGFYSYTLPDFYYVSDGNQLTVNSVFSISSRPSEQTLQAVEALEGNTAMNTHDREASLSKLEDSTLMLFGTVPIKDVQTGQISRPKLVPCGQPFGIKLVTEGVMVIDLERFEGCCPASECGIKKGDVIISVNGVGVTTNKSISDIISGSKGKPCTVEYRSGDNEKTATLTPVYHDGSYKAGMWVRDSSAGIGTLTFYDPSTGAFGGLGHPICDADTKLPLPLSQGSVGEVRITGFNKSVKGDPGQLLGEFSSSASVGNIDFNNESGVFGTLNSPPSSSKPIELGFRQEVHTGEAVIYTTIDNGKPKEYKINIEKADLSSDAEHDLIVKITDPKLLETTGGILQGMSGSPIIQDGRLVGAVTHVFIDDPQQGYGIFADSMYRQSTKCVDPELGMAG
ncbi:SpoIVB peptidase [Hominimerdicola sp. 21CYCFAH17_S]